MLQLGQHPNVVTLLGCCTERIPYFLILEYAENGKLLNYLRKYQNGEDAFCRLTFTDLVIFAFQSAKGMQFISSYGVRSFNLCLKHLYTTPHITLTDCLYFYLVVRSFIVTWLLAMCSWVEIKCVR